MSKSLVFILSFLFIGSAFGQEKYSTTVSLKWHEQSFDNILDNKDAIAIQTFKNAAFDSQTPEIPRYLHHLSLPGKGLLDITVIPIKTSAISITEQNSIEKVGSTFSASYEITQSKNEFQGNISITPIRKTKSGHERLEEFSLTVSFTPKLTNSQTRDGNTFTSVLSNGAIYKIPVTASGVYQISGNFLSNELGIQSGSVSSASIQLFSNIGGRLPRAIDTERADDLVEIPVLVNDGGDGKIDENDNIRFYVEGTDRWSMSTENDKYIHDKNVYDVNNYIFLKIDGNGGKRVEASNSINSAEYISDAFDYLQIYEDDRTNLLGANISTEGTGKDWYGDYFGVETSKSYKNLFDISDVSSSGTGRVKLRLAARGASSTTTKLKIGSQQFSQTASGTNLSDIEADYAKEVIIDEELTLNTNSDIDLEFVKSSPQDEAWLDYVLLEYRKNITSNYAQLRLSDKSSLNYSTAGFEVPASGFQYWDVTDIGNTKLINPSNGNIRYDVNNELKTFYMVKDGEYLTPESNGALIENQNIHGIEKADLIILYHEEFKDAADRLAQHRRTHDGYTVETVDIKTVYNEFSGGRLDPTAIRDFARMIVNRDQNFRYLLLLGDASYDYRNITPNISDHNFIPPYETDESLDPINGFPSDDYYVLLSDGEGSNLKGAIDVAVGRIPVTTAEMANGVIDKIIDYDTNKAAFGDWRLKIAFAADDEDTNLHVRQADEMAKKVEIANPEYNQTKIYFDTYIQESTPGGDRYPAATEAINSTIQNGALLGSGKGVKSTRH